MKKILLIDNSYPINTRNQKIIKTLNKKFDVKFASWNRANSVIKKCDKNMYIYNSNEGYNNKVAKLIGMFKFFLYLNKVLNDFDPDYVIASHWDMLFLASILKNKNYKLIYDNLDIPTASSKLFLKSFKKIERISLKKTDAIIFASRFYKDLYSNYVGEKLVLENKPLEIIKETDNLNINNYLSEIDSSKTKISFIGGIRYLSIMKNLVLASKYNNSNIELLFFGGGKDEGKLKKYCTDQNIKNVHFFGTYEYKNIGQFYKLSDVIWAAYPYKDYNVKYAISNKFFETLIFNKPCIYSENTKLGSYVKKINIGLTVDPYSIDEIDFLFKELVNNKGMLEPIKENIKKINKFNYWKDHEKKLIELFSKVK
ncbi:Glycosyltransferase involved in cell wall bisynthesis [Halanaerobium congolense]|uniref:Glycosyltransferase involved in cell wall bisynthesis n=1 Tax=Halanaerobium congolense TaxID=54121 RepID=A0A1G8R2W7_9FIRM|nr:glycosyltransferase [Halanaerobium congolense]SDJ11344.1 Glycosyltransferase involved in cell wall bisynthesis [Halanaerobium congolense]SET66085.1 Glycosyltransferase involved in cell wall bisynthesis [Halanaerobium congolense]